MFKQYLDTIGKIVIYGNGEKLLEKERDFHKIGTMGAEKVNESYYSRILSINLNQEPKNARKENLNRKDNYFLSYTPHYCSWERRTALYIHLSEVSVKNLGEFIAFDANGEKCFLYAYQVEFMNGAGADIHHFEKMTVSSDWTLPEGAAWDRGRDYYKIIDADAQVFRKKRAEANGEEYDGANLMHHWFTAETITHTVWTSEGYHKIIKDDARQEREKLAEALNNALGSRNHISHYDVERLLKVFDIKIKNTEG